MISATLLFALGVVVLRSNSEPLTPATWQPKRGALPLCGAGAPGWAQQAVNILGAIWVADPNIRAKNGHDLFRFALLCNGLYAARGGIILYRSYHGGARTSL